MNVMPVPYPISFPPLRKKLPHLIFYKIWGEIGKKLGGKNIKKNTVKYFDKKHGGSNYE